MASALIAGAAAGGVSDLRTSVAMTSKDIMEAFRLAGLQAARAVTKGLEKDDGCRSTQRSYKDGMLVGA